MIWICGGRCCGCNLESWVEKLPRLRHAPSPRLRGEGWGEGADDSRGAQHVETPPHPKFAMRISTSPRARGEVKPALQTNKDESPTCPHLTNTSPLLASA